MSIDFVCSPSTINKFSPIELSNYSADELKELYHLLSIEFDSLLDFIGSVSYYPNYKNKKYDYAITNKELKHGYDDIVNNFMLNGYTKNLAISYAYKMSEIEVIKKYGHCRRVNSNSSDWLFNALDYCDSIIKNRKYIREYLKKNFDIEI